MKAILGLALVGALAGVYFMTNSTTELDNESIDRMFEDFIMENRRSYASVDEYKYRLGVFKQNLQIAAEYQKDQDEAIFGVTIFSDVTQEEFKSRLGFKAPLPGSRPVKHTNVDTSVTGERNWQDINYAVKDQGGCGSCWSFSASAAAEPRARLAGINPTPNLAEQQCLECDTESEGCNGGWMTTCFKHLRNKNLCSEDEYPYTAIDGVCSETDRCSGKMGWEISGVVEIAEGDCAGLDAADDEGPVSIAVDATAMQFYSSGIIKPGMLCGDKADSLNHGIAVYGESVSGGYWLTKNSWGVRWGEKGYARFKLGNTCGLCLVASYPSIKLTGK